eukprot:1136521-Pelagomonas_calceolata.AAC.5
MYCLEKGNGRGIWGTSEGSAASDAGKLEKPVLPDTEVALTCSAWGKNRAYPAAHHACIAVCGVAAAAAAAAVPGGGCAGWTRKARCEVHREGGKSRGSRFMNGASPKSVFPPS